MDTWTLSTCPRCEASVIEAPLEFGSPILLNLEPSPDGNHILVDGRAEFRYVFPEGEDRYTPHSCRQRPHSLLRQAMADILLRRWIRVKWAKGATCRKCEARLIFGETAEGKFVPLNPRLIAGRKWPPLWRLTDTGHVSQWSGSASSPGLISHHCPESAPSKQADGTI